MMSNRRRRLRPGGTRPGWRRATLAAGGLRVPRRLAGASILARVRLGRVGVGDLVLGVVLRVDPGPGLAVLRVARADVGGLFVTFGHAREVPGGRVTDAGTHARRRRVLRCRHRDVSPVHSSPSAAPASRTTSKSGDGTMPRMIVKAPKTTATATPSPCARRPVAACEPPARTGRSAPV